MFVQTFLVYFDSFLDWTQLEFKIPEVVRYYVNFGSDFLASLVCSDDNTLSINTSVFIGSWFWEVPGITTYATFAVVFIPKFL